MQTIIVLFSIIIVNIYMISVVILFRVLTGCNTKGIKRKYKGLFEDYQDKICIKEGVKEGFYIYGTKGEVIECMLLYTKSMGMERRNKGKFPIAILCLEEDGGRFMKYRLANMYLEQEIYVLTYRIIKKNKKLKTTSFGYKEKYVLQLVVDTCYEKYGLHIALIIHGVGISANTVMSLLSIDCRPRIVVLDSPISNINDYFRERIQSYYLPAFLFKWLLAYLFYLLHGVSLEDASSKNSVEYSNTPILFIHGKLDKTVSYSMSEQLYNRKKDKKKILLIENCGHLEGFIKEYSKYYEAIDIFIKEYY